MEIVSLSIPLLLETGPDRHTLVLPILGCHLKSCLARCGKIFFNGRTYVIVFPVQFLAGAAMLRHA